MLQKCMGALTMVRSGMTRSGVSPRRPTVFDGVCAAINQGIEQADKQMESELEKVTGGVKIPGMT